MRPCEEEEKEHAQRKEAGAAPVDRLPIRRKQPVFHQRQGNSLPADVNQSMSDAFGSDFSHVRIIPIQQLHG